MDLLTAPGRRRAAIALAATVGGGALLGIGGAWAKGVLAHAEISACLDPRGYLYQPQDGGSCPAGSLTWNQQGPAGQQGPQGPAGPQGEPGPTGPQGPPSSSAAKKVLAVNARALRSSALKVVKSASYYKKTTPNSKDNFPTQNTAGARCPAGWIAIAGTWANGDISYTGDDAGFRVTVPEKGTVHGARLEGFENGHAKEFVVYYRWPGPANRSFVHYLIVQVSCLRVVS